MSIKPDHWIERMAREHAMIEPFEANQVRDGVISYGLSSYGYDIRVADEFKVFTNVYTTVVDPKHFDARSFIEFKGDVCTIPPNSFALARTIEYFRIPRNVLTVCVGKCVSGDTRVVDAETGAYLPIAQMAGTRKTLGMEEWRLKPVEVTDFIPNGVRPVYELTTRLGLKIKATANHPFRRLSGWMPLAGLRPGDRIAVARQVPVFGKTPMPDWEAILLGLMIAEGQCDTPGHSPVFTTDDPVLVSLLEDCVDKGFQGAVSHNGHVGYRLVNKLGRGGHAKHNRAHVWLKEYGLNVGAGQKFVPQAIFMAPPETVALFLRALFSGDGSIYASNQAIYLEYYSNSRRLVEDVHHLLLRFGIVSLIRKKQTQIHSTAYRIQITDREHIHRFAQKVGFWPGSSKQIRLEQEVRPMLLERARRQRSNFDTLPSEGWDLMRRAAADAHVSLRSLGVERTQPDQSLPYRLATPVALATSDPDLLGLVDGPIWDVVKSIEYAGEEAVYDLTVPGAHNFVANDFIIHNSTYARCGIIVNVTPFEPEWEGFVTLEISNTTPLPARIYSNEGIAQVLFFEADEICRVSYADRKGKYQKQMGIMLPHITEK
jgi:deoxycytidine triphosphate deaminase